MESSNYYTIPQLINEVSTYDYKLLELVDESGRKVIPGNPVNEKPTTWLKNKVAPWIKKTNIRPGAYYILAYTDSRKKIQPDHYPLKVGKITTVAEGVAIPPIKINFPKTTMAENPGTLTYQEALDLVRENAELKAKVGVLERENEDLKKKVDRLESQEEKTLSEGKNKDFLAEMMPLADHFLEERKQQRNLELLLKAKNDPFLRDHLHLILGTGSNASLSEKTQQIKQKALTEEEKEEVRLANEFFEDRENCSEEEWQVLEQIKSKSGSHHQFFETMEKQLPEVYDRLMEFVEAGGYEEEEEQEEEEESQEGGNNE